MPENISSKYEPAKHEPAIYQIWEKSNSFSPENKPDGDPYAIMLPPPNITGSLHMGHALQDTIMDTLARFQRMQGKSVLWLPGTDSAAIATNRVIENQLQQEGKTRQEIGREAFLARVDAWYKKTGSDILNQMKRLGCSCDWSRLRFTMDDGYLAAVNEAFIRYYEAGYIYRGSRIVNWDPKTQTTVSDLEIEWQTVKAPLYTFQYGPFAISTARPETKFGDKYVVMHPDNARYREYKEGDTFTAEWINGPVLATVIKDEAIDPGFGTGVMTITPWHDATDFAIAERHGLDSEQIIGFDGKLLPLAGEFAGLGIEEARPLIVAKLSAKGLLLKTDDRYEHNVAVNDRGKGGIEPQVMRQWFINMSRLKEETIQAAQADLVRFVPGRWKKHFTSWMENVYDWNINRQIWLGHRLPVWWKKGTHGTDQEAGNFVVSLEKPAGYWERDPDVLDTWFATALWPFAVLGWPKNTPDLEKYYPSQVLVTARDILYLWVARMVFSGLKFMQGEEYGRRDLTHRIPFQDVFIHPTVLAKDGRRMSKSLGTGIDPLELIDAYGADATRFGLMMQMNFDSQAIKFDERDIQTARNFANKIWNISRLLASLPQDGGAKKTLADRWIIGESHRLASEVNEHLLAYRIGEAARALFDFIWQEYAGWYLEILKIEGSPEVAREVFVMLIKLLHPIMPHVTETVYQQHFRTKAEPLLITAAWPKGTAQPDPAASQGMDLFKDVVSTIRSARVLLNLPPAEGLRLHCTADIPLTAALERLCRASLLTQPEDSMVRFPLSSGFISIASPSLTPETIQSAREKLASAINNLQQLITKREEIINRMLNKAPADKIASQKEEISLLQARLAETERSFKYLN